MEDLLFTIDVVIPMFLIMGAGYVLRRFNVIPQELIIVGNQLCYRVLLPVTLFNSLISSDFSQAFDVTTVVFTLSIVTCWFFVVWAVMPHIIKDRRQIPVIDQALIRTNLVVFGFPLCAATFGAAGTTAVATVTAFLSPLVNTLTIVFYSMYSGDKKTSPKEIVKSIVTNPLILCSVAGALVLLLGIKLPAVATSALTDLGKITTPLALLLLGADFKFGGLKKNTKPLLVGILGRHLVVPAISLVIAALIGIRGANFVTLVAVFSAPVASSSFAMSHVYGADAEFTGQYVVLSSAAASLSIFAGIYLARIFALI